MRATASEPLDVASQCVRAVMMGDVLSTAVGRRAAGSRVRFPLTCADPFHACSITLEPRLTRRGTRSGVPLPPVRVRVPAGATRRASVRLPAGAKAGRRVLRLSVRSAAPFPLVAPYVGRLDVFLVVVRRRG